MNADETKEQTAERLFSDGIPRGWKLLLVEDDPASRESLAEYLDLEGFEVVTADSVRQAIAELPDRIGLIVTDLVLPDGTGLDLLRHVQEHAPHIGVILITGHATVDTAVAALRQGALDYLTKPVNLDELVERVRRGLRERATALEVAALRDQVQQEARFGMLVGRSPAMQRVFEQIKLVAPTRATVLITGESGTGKELVARAIHANSRRAHRPFIPVNCPAIPESLLESELFGHERGAFTGAVAKKKGLFQAADGGTLFIDEVSELPEGAQAKLLRAVETRRIMPVGSTQEIEVDVRLVAATNRNLQERVKEGRFREDLYYRLRVAEIYLPPLRERIEDIPLLVDHFVREICEDTGRPPLTVTPEAMKVLMRYPWPGNVRELRNTLEGVIVFCKGDRIDVDDLPEHIRTTHAVGNDIFRPGMTMEELEREAIRRTLEFTKGKRTEAARLLGISLRTLQRKIKEYNLT